MSCGVQNEDYLLQWNSNDSEARAGLASEISRVTVLNSGANQFGQFCGNRV